MGNKILANNVDAENVSTNSQTISKKHNYMLKLVVFLLVIFGGVMSFANPASATHSTTYDDSLGGCTFSDTDSNCWTNGLPDAGANVTIAVGSTFNPTVNVIGESNAWGSIVNNGTISCGAAVVDVLSTGTFNLGTIFGGPCFFQLAVTSQPGSVVIVLPPSPEIMADICQLGMPPTDAACNHFGCSGSGPNRMLPPGVCADFTPPELTFTSSCQQLASADVGSDDTKGGGSGLPGTVSSTPGNGTSSGGLGSFARTAGNALNILLATLMAVMAFFARRFVQNNQEAQDKLRSFFKISQSEKVSLNLLDTYNWQTAKPAQARKWGERTGVAMMAFASVFALKLFLTGIMLVSFQPALAESASAVPVRCDVDVTSNTRNIVVSVELFEQILLQGAENVIGYTQVGDSVILTLDWQQIQDDVNAKFSLIFSVNPETQPFAYDLLLGYLKLMSPEGSYINRKPLTLTAEKITLTLDDDFYFPGDKATITLIDPNAQTTIDPDTGEEILVVAFDNGTESVSVTLVKQPDGSFKGTTKVKEGEDVFVTYGDQIASAEIVQPTKVTTTPTCIDSKKTKTTSTASTTDRPTQTTETIERDVLFSSSVRVSQVDEEEEEPGIFRNFVAFPGPCDPDTILITNQQAEGLVKNQFYRIVSQNAQLQAFFSEAELRGFKSWADVQKALDDKNLPVIVAQISSNEYLVQIPVHDPTKELEVFAKFAPIDPSRPATIDIQLVGLPENATSVDQRMLLAETSAQLFKPAVQEGTISLDRASYIPGERAIVTVEAPGLAGQGTVTANISSDVVGSQNSINLTLNELTPGKFSGTVILGGVDNPRIEGVKVRVPFEGAITASFGASAAVASIGGGPVPVEPTPTPTPPTPPAPVEPTPTPVVPTPVPPVTPPVVPTPVEPEPDLDQDTIVDRDDLCPTVAGTADFNGCPTPTIDCEIVALNLECEGTTLPNQPGTVTLTAVPPTVPTPTPVPGEPVPAMPEPTPMVPPTGPSQGFIGDETGQFAVSFPLPDLTAGTHQVSVQVVGKEGVLTRPVVISTVQLSNLNIIAATVRAAVEAVETPAKITLAAAVPVLVVTSPAVLPSLPSIPYFLSHLVVQILSALGLLKKRKPWGKVYDAITKEALGLAVIRLIDASTNRVVATQVTDKEGRFVFLPPRPGKYRMEVRKADYTWPSSVVTTQEDGTFKNVSQSGIVEFTEGSEPTLNLPLDPRKPGKESIWRKIQDVSSKYALLLLLLGTVLSLVVYAFIPTVLNLVILLAYATVAVLQGLLQPKKEKPWGMVFDAISKEPVPLAVINIIDTKYERLLKSRLTDYKGRFSFLPPAGEYRITVKKSGFTFPSSNREIKDVKKTYYGDKLVLKKAKGIINANIPMDKEMGSLTEGEPQVGPSSETSSMGGGQNEEGSSM